MDVGLKSSTLELNLDIPPLMSLDAHTGWTMH